jgi:hypothetical protein
MLTGSRMLKKAYRLTRPTPARRDAPFHGRGRSEWRRRGGTYHTSCEPFALGMALGERRDPFSLEPLRVKPIAPRKDSNGCPNKAGGLFQHPGKRRLGVYPAQPVPHGVRRSSQAREFCGGHVGDGEDGAKPSRSRHCKRGERPHRCHCVLRHAGRRGRSTIRESGDPADVVLLTLRAKGRKTCVRSVGIDPVLSLSGA